MDLLPPSYSVVESKWALSYVLVAIIVSSVLFIEKQRRRSSSDNDDELKKEKAPEAKGGLPLIGHLHLLGGPVPVFRTLSSMAESHGPIFSLRLGFHTTLIVSSRELARECLTTIDKVFASRPNIAAGRYMGYNNAFFALAPYGEYWREMRKIATLELLSSHRLQQLKHVRDSEILCLVKDLFSTHRHKLRNLSDMVEVPMSQLLEHLTFNIIVRIIAGKRFSGDEKDLSDEENEGGILKRAVREATYLSGVFVEADGLPLTSMSKWVDFQGHVRAMKKTAMDIDSVLHEWLHQHLLKRTNHAGEDFSETDFMDILISTFSDPDERICGHPRDVVIKATALTLILTGTGSTAITLTWALSLLLNHPRVLKKAQDELDSNVGTHKWVQESDMKQLQYLQAIIKETLRLYPPAPLTGIREAMEDCFVGGYYVPKGTRLLINIWKLHRDPQVWTNPDEFVPERFMEDHKDLDFKGQNIEYIPFSSGRRSCPAANFGIQVVSLTLARLLQGFDLSTTTKDGVAVEMSEGLGVALPKLNPLRVMIKPRLSFELYQQL
ncbi:dimethylnonatriene synthase-like isoform X1 [Prosopis cineraria]|uniref:dimethylnonatriene synthase-like isoform X1 n=1 Tax=Prosopis cineraria TaxID=364024 RepID=UPI00240F3131|nr:dimethylnonatriene synthase-like isoform X1 [Prosopis cineraria]